MSEITLTIRLIKSFEYKTVKNIVIRVNPSITIKELKDIVNLKKNELKVYKTLNLNTMKNYFTKHGHKSQNLIINLEEIGFLEDSKTLQELEIGDEGEISYFEISDYEKYKQNPQLKWE